jgi:malate dehydrogenase (oxaloacetate-decarboxylating)
VSRNEGEIDPQLKDVLPVHEGGKTQMVSRCKLDTVADLRRIYTPGVALVSKLIESDPSQLYAYTSVGNTVAVISNGAAVLGLGDVGARASMPVMEGKAVILMQMADISAVPLLVDTHDSDAFVQTVRLISPTFGGILLEDVAAPMCFEVECRLRECCDVPVFHDDQHGTAVVVLGAMINALRVTGKRASDLNVAMSGAGAAGWAVAHFLLDNGVGNVVLCDRIGAIYRGRKEGMHPAKKRIAEETNRDNEKGPLEEVIRGKDAFIGVSTAGLVSGQMVRSMAPGAIVFAMANPIPEIWPHKALEAGAAVATDGRHLNNVLGFPGIFRGALDARACHINEEMKRAAAGALADLAPDGELVPDFMDRAVHRAVADAVADAARDSGVARA